MTRYETFRSGKDNRINVICGEGEFYSLPEHILHLRPWVGGLRGDIEGLRPAYRALLAEQGFVVIYRHPYDFDPEMG